MGRDFYRLDDFCRVPAVDTDASKSPRYVGGGYFSRSGHYRYWFHGSSARWQPIDWLEGDTLHDIARARCADTRRRMAAPSQTATDAVTAAATVASPCSALATEPGNQ
eukprot:2431713-Pleurochrysis_carterae.AAC.1